MRRRAGGARPELCAVKEEEEGGESRAGGEDALKAAVAAGEVRTARPCKSAQLHAGRRRDVGAGSFRSCCF